MLTRARFQVYGMLSILGLSTPLMHSGDHLRAEDWGAVGPSIRESQAAYAQVPGGDDDESLQSFTTARGGGFARTATLPNPQIAEPSTLVVTFHSQDAYGQLLKGGIGGSSVKEGTIHRLLRDFAKEHQGKLRIIKNEIFYTPTAWDEGEKIKSTGRTFEITLPAGQDPAHIKQSLKDLLDPKAILAIKAQDEERKKGLAIGVQEPMLISALSEPTSKLRAIIDAVINRYTKVTGVQPDAVIVDQSIKKHKRDGGISYRVLFDEQAPGQRDAMVRMFSNLLTPQITITTQSFSQKSKNVRTRHSAHLGEDARGTLGTHTEDGDDDDGAGVGL